MRMKAVRNDTGQSLTEVLVAVAILAVGLLGLGGGMIQSGVVSAATVGQASVARGYSVSTATMLAQDRLEQVKRLTYSLTVDELAASPPAGFADEGFGAIAAYPAYSRIVRVENYPVENMKTITVTVTHRHVATQGMRTESLALSTLVAARP